MFNLRRTIVLLLVFVCFAIKVNAATVVLNNASVSATEKNTWSFWGDNLSVRLKDFILNDISINNKDFTYSFSVDEQGNVEYKSVASSDLKNLKIITANMKSIIKVLNKNAIVKFPQKTVQKSVIIKGSYTGKVKKNIAPTNSLVVELSSVSANKISSVNTKANVTLPKKEQTKNTVSQIMIDGELVNVQTVDIGEETVSSLVWNQWRADVTNAFLKTSVKYPFGRNKEAVKVKYSFEIDNQGNITNIYVTPYDNYGNACSEETRLVILDSAKMALAKMQHSLLLRFPEGSKRTKVVVTGTYVPSRGKFIGANASDYNDIETVHTVN